jgi:hypothetical protein
LGSTRERQATTYSLEKLYLDQAPDHVMEVMAPTIAWLSEASSLHKRVSFDLWHGATRKRAAQQEMVINWDPTVLAAYDADVIARAERIREGRSALTEKCTELAGYGLALSAISVFLPGRRVVAWRKWSAPDLLLDATPGKLRSVEAAARSTGGSGALRRLLSEKRTALGRLPDVAEAHVALWCRRPRVGMMIRVRP